MFHWLPCISGINLDPEQLPPAQFERQKKDNYTPNDQTTINQVTKQTVPQKEVINSGTTQIKAELNLLGNFDIRLCLD